MGEKNKKKKKRRKNILWVEKQLLVVVVNVISCMAMTQMSLVTDSPVHSSSSDDFVSYLDGALDASSPDSSSEEDDENQDDVESARCYLQALLHIFIIYGSSCCDFINL